MDIEDIVQTYLQYRVLILGAPQILRFCTPVVDQLNVQSRLSEYARASEADTIVVGGDCKDGDRLSVYRRGRGSLQIAKVTVRPEGVTISLNKYTGGVLWEEEATMTASKSYPGRFYLDRVVLKGIGNN